METKIQTERQNSEQSPSKPLLPLVEILLSLADVFKFNMTERAISAYSLTVAHRTDADLNTAYRKILRDSRFMPTPAELADACGIMRERRDGSKPE